MPLLLLGAFAGPILMSASVLAVALGWCAAVSFCASQGGARR